ncbi:MAG: glycosyltransferase family 2 protein [candidate division KSB1 bacterium]|nr:glycosyltransferase family 2 protein [candidate division KSB1 bacterium]MDZ7300833.1 glycosyltransferase family 2 protein [candidate division KSB1 bacterium]MDZ7309896.1 glycosyltransferase family 2 protein [candidate division KSB1 bacterium]
MYRVRSKNHESKNPLVWILVVNWNGREDTLACLASLRKVSYQPRHILVIDNASTDGSVEAIREQFPEVEVLANAKNERFARANNQGMEKALAAGAGMVLLLNNDTEVAPDFLEHLVAAAESRPDVGMVAPKIYYHHDPQLLWFAGGRVNFWTGRIYHLGLRQHEAPQSDQQEHNSPEVVDFLTGCAILAKRECLEKIGWLDESYYMYVEDVDWCWRARQAGFVCLYQPAAKIWHKVSASAGDSFKIYHKVLGNFVFFRRYARWYHWPTIVLSVAAGAVIEIFRQLRRSPAQALSTTGALLRGFADIFLRRRIAKQ